MKKEEQKTNVQLSKEVTDFIKCLEDNLFIPHFKMTVFKNEQAVRLTGENAYDPSDYLDAFDPNDLPDAVERMIGCFHSDTAVLTLVLKIPNNEVLRLLARKGKAVWRKR